MTLLIFLPPILIPAFVSSSLAFRMMYSAYKLNKQGTIHSLDVLLSDLEPVCCSLSSFDCFFLTCKQISQEAGQVVLYSHLFKNFPQFVVIHTAKGVGIVNKAKADVFLELSCFFKRLSSKSLQIINAGEGMEKRESSYPVYGSANWYNYYGEQ